ncbi:MAG: hypothetical protein ACLPSH_12325 [Vulcanimicrobiaceae bacterium]
MSINESLERVLEQSRELQYSIIDAFDKATDDIRPQIARSLHTARDLQVTLTKHMEAEAGMICENTAAAKSLLDDYMVLATHAMQESSGQLRTAARQLVRQAVNLVDAANAATKP